MGFFGKLFEKKECSICGGEIGLLGNRKLEDGNCCKECAGKLSPWFDDRRHSTVEMINQQLAYRRENAEALKSFRPTLAFGENYTLRAEIVNGIPSRFVVERTDDYLEENADLINFKDVISFEIDVSENEEELQQRNSEGEYVSYNPPRYEFSYDFYGEIRVNHPYFDDIRFEINRDAISLETVDRFSRGGISSVRQSFDPMRYPEYRQYRSICDELEALFHAGMHGLTLPGFTQEPVGGVQSVQQTPADVAQPVPQEPARPKFCQNCGAPADGGKFCQSCGSPL